MAAHRLASGRAGKRPVRIWLPLRAASGPAAGRSLGVVGGWLPSVCVAWRPQRAEWDGSGECRGSRGDPSAARGYWGRPWVSRMRTPRARRAACTVLGRRGRGADAGEGLAVLVEADGVIDVIGIETSASHGDALAVQVQVQGHCVLVDPEPLPEFVHRRPGVIMLHQKGDLSRGKRPSARPMATWCSRLGVCADVA
jgi:hypothetical protein